MKRVVVESQVAKMFGKFDRAMGAVHFARLDAPHGFDQLIVVRVV